MELVKKFTPKKGFYANTIQDANDVNSGAELALISGHMASLTDSMKSPRNYSLVVEEIWFLFKNS